MQIRKAILTLHLCAGLLASVFLLVLGLTGSLLVFGDEIDRALNAKLTWIQPGVQRLSLTEIRTRLEKDYPGYKILGIGIPPRPNMAWSTFLSNESLHKQMGLAFDPYTGAVVGNQSDRNDFMGKVHQLHLRLMAGETGATIVSWAAVFLFFLALSGVVLWWPRKILWVNWRNPAKLINWELHQTLGIYLSIFLLIFSLTAMVIHWDDAAMKVVNRATASAEVPDFPESQQAPTGAVPVSPDQLLATAEAAAPGARATAVQFMGNLVRIWMMYPEDRTPSGRTNVFVDQYTGKIVYLVDSRTAPLGYRVVKMWNREIHTGDIGGMPTRILACLMSLLLPISALTGPLIWLLRLGKNKAAISDTL